VERGKQAEIKISSCVRDQLVLRFTVSATPLVNTHLFKRAATPFTEALPHGHETVLLVEDETDLRILVTHLLRCCGFQVLPAASGAAAMEIWDELKDRIQLLLTDIMMPGMTGGELAGGLQRERPDLKVMFMSGHGNELKAGGMALVEGVNFVPKPYKVCELAQAVRQRLDRAD